jgi:predicted oxidoreductase
VTAAFDGKLVATIERFGRMARAGVDEDFARGASRYERYMTDWMGPGDGPNRTMRPLDPRGPYFATVIVPATIDTKGGPRIDRDARVLNLNGRPVSGLYAAGNCTASPSGEAYWAGGTSIGLAMCFGFAAARHVTKAYGDLAVH